jgi:hypothetical protein
MPAYNPPAEINGIPLSDRSRWLLYAPVWMLFPNWRRRVLFQPVNYISQGLGLLRSELR